MEATAQCEDGKRKIFVKIFMEKEGRICVIKLVNNFATPRVQHNSGFVSTKRNRKIHGIGLKSVEGTAKKYGGYLQCLIEDEKFVSILILPVRK